MTMYCRLFLLLACCLLPSADLLADDDELQLDELRKAVAEGRIVPLERILEDALRRVPGKVVDIELDLEDDEYEIEVLDADGIVWELEYRASDGALRDIERND